MKSIFYSLRFIFLSIWWRASYPFFKWYNQPYRRMLRAANLSQKNSILIDTTIYTPDQLEIIFSKDVADEVKRMMLFDKKENLGIDFTRVFVNKKTHSVNFTKLKRELHA